MYFIFINLTTLILIYKYYIFELHNYNKDHWNSGITYFNLTSGVMITYYHNTMTK